VTRDPAAISRFVERFASVLAEGGMARMPARVFAALISTDEGRMTAAEIADTLRISAAAVSGAVRYLEQVSLVGREREPGSRRDRYVVQHDLWYEAILQREQLLTRWERALTEGVDALGADTPAGRRLENSVAFFEFLQEEMPAMLERWRARESAGSRGRA
jgi:DNA-binding transcriptional regulator GbsR (MarR family)